MHTCFRRHFIRLRRGNRRLYHVPDPESAAAEAARVLDAAGSLLATTGSDDARERDLAWGSLFGEILRGRRSRFSGDGRMLLLGHSPKKFERGRLRRRTDRPSREQARPVRPGTPLARDAAERMPRARRAIPPPGEHERVPGNDTQVMDTSSWRALEIEPRQVELIRFRHDLGDRKILDRQPGRVEQGDVSSASAALRLAREDEADVRHPVSGHDSRPRPRPPARRRGSPAPSRRRRDRRGRLAIAGLMVHHRHVCPSRREPSG